MTSTEPKFKSLERIKIVLNPRKLQLHFESNKPYPAKSRVVVSGCYGKEKDGEPRLTPECVNPTELGVWIDELKQQLDECKNEAQRKYARYEKGRWLN